MTGQPTAPDSGGAAGVDRVPAANLVAFGGGHGLSATLRALRQLGHAPTAVVTVADDGGSSGRLRRSRPVLPPGDLRQALAALAADDDTSATNAKLMQHRFAGRDELTGHAVGNLLLLGLFELLGDPVLALDHAAELVRATGRVLPLSRVPLSIQARVLPPGATEPVTVRGQHEVAISDGSVREVLLVPDRPPACAEAVRAVGVADWLLLGPGSWYTSVIPHLLVPELREAIVASPARKLVTLNLAAETETAGLSAADHLAALAEYAPGLRLDVVVAHDAASRDVTGHGVVDARASGGAATGRPGADRGAVAGNGTHLGSLGGADTGAGSDDARAIDRGPADGRATERGMVDARGDDTGPADLEPLRAAAASLGARLVTAPVAVDDGTPRHDPAALAAVLGRILADRHPPGRSASRSGGADAWRDNPTFQPVLQARGPHADMR